MPLSSSSKLILFREAYHFIESGENGKNQARIGGALQSFPFSYPYPGYITNSGTQDSLSTFSYYWLIDSQKTTTANNMTFNPNRVLTQNNSTKKGGFSVRRKTNRTDTTQRNKFISSPYNFPYSGNYNYGSGVDNQGSNGRWWSRSSYTTAGQAYYFYLNTNGYVYPQNNDYVGYGIVVRCVAE